MMWARSLGQDRERRRRPRPDLIKAIKATGDRPVAEVAVGVRSHGTTTPFRMFMPQAKATSPVFDWGELDRDSLVERRADVRAARRQGCVTDVARVTHTGCPVHTSTDDT
jgi:hypothetical protein